MHDFWYTIGLFLASFIGYREGIVRERKRNKQPFEWKCGLCSLTIETNSQAGLLNAAKIHTKQHAAEVMKQKTPLTGCICPDEPWRTPGNIHMDECPWSLHAHP